MSSNDDDGPFIDEGGEPKPKRTRAPRRRRGSIEVLPSLAVRVRFRDVVLPDGRKVPGGVAYTIPAEAFRTVAEREREARERVKPMLLKRVLDLESGLAAFDANITLAEAVQRLRQDKTQPFKWRRADDSLWKRCRPLWNVPLASCCEASRIRGMVDRWTAEEHSGAYIRSLVALVRRVLGRAAERGWITRAPVWPSGLMPAKSKTSRGMSAKLDEHQKAAVFAAAHARDVECGTDLATRLAFQLDLGLRPIECAWARIEDLREGDDGRWWFHPHRAKGSGLRPDEGEDRLPVSVDLARAVLRFVDGLPGRAQALGWLFPVKGLSNTWRPRFTEKGGTRRADAWVTEAEVEDVRRRSGVAFYPYQLRHTRAHELVTAGMSAAELQRYGAWRNKDMPAIYAGMVRELPEVASSTLAPVPGPGKLRAIAGGKNAARAVSVAPGAEGFTPDVNLREPRGRDFGAANEAPRSPDVNPLGASVDAGGRGHVMGAGAPSTPFAEVSAWLDEAAEWKAPRQAVAAWGRKLGPAEIRRRSEVAAAVEAAGGVHGREGSLRALVLALAARVAQRGPKRAPVSTEKANNLRCVGAAGDYPTK